MSYSGVLVSLVCFALLNRGDSARLGKLLGSRKGKKTQQDLLPKKRLEKLSFLLGGAGEQILHLASSHRSYVQ